MTKYSHFSPRIFLWCLCTALACFLSPIQLSAQPESEQNESEEIELYDENGEIKKDVLDSLLKDGLTIPASDDEFEEKDATPIVVSVPPAKSNTIDAELQAKYADSLAFKMVTKQNKLDIKSKVGQDFLEWITNVIQKVVKFLRFTNLGNILVVCLVIGIGFFIYYLIRKNKAKIVQKSDDDLPTDDWSDEELIQKSDLNNLLLKAERSGKLKSAFRFRYLMLIKQMDEYDVIDWRPSYTNDALRRLIRIPELQLQFKDLTIAYEYLWYGDYPINQKEYARLTSVIKQSIYLVETERVD